MVGRPARYDGMANMTTDEVTWKGLDIKCRAAKCGIHPGFIPFLSLVTPQRPQSYIITAAKRCGYTIILQKPWTQSHSEHSSQGCCNGNWIHTYRICVDIKTQGLEHTIYGKFRGAYSSRYITKENMIQPGTGFQTFRSSCYEHINHKCESILVGGSDDMIWYIYYIIYVYTYCPT